MHKTILTIASVYLGAVGAALMFAPIQFGIGAVPADASPALIAFLRVLGGPCIGIAVLNWLGRRSAPSRELEAILIANIVGFACVAAMDIWGVFSGGARPPAKIFLLVHLIMTAAFVLAYRRTEV